MPKYSYKCKNCDSEFVFFHSMSEKKEDCEVCDNKTTLKKLPSQFTTTKGDTTCQVSQVGDVVRRSIKDTKDELKQEKEKLSNEFYNSNK